MKGGGMFIPQALLPEQVEGTRADQPNYQSIRNLMSAVLQDALECFFKYMLDESRHSQRIFVEAKTWIFDQTDWPFSFSHVCGHLGVDDIAAREALLNLEKYYHGKPLQDAPGEEIYCRRCKKETEAVPLLDLPLSGGVRFLLCTGCGGTIKRRKKHWRRKEEI